MWLQQVDVFIQALRCRNWNISISDRVYDLLYLIGLYVCIITNDGWIAKKNCSTRCECNDYSVQKDTESLNYKNMFLSQDYDFNAKLYLKHRIMFKSVNYV